jgi:hypothetical protein
MTSGCTIVAIGITMMIGIDRVEVRVIGTIGNGDTTVAIE